MFRYLFTLGVLALFGSDTYCQTVVARGPFGINRTVVANGGQTVVSRGLFRSTVVTGGGFNSGQTVVSRGLFGSTVVAGGGQTVVSRGLFGSTVVTGGGVPQRAFVAVHAVQATPVFVPSHAVVSHGYVQRSFATAAYGSYAAPALSFAPMATYAQQTVAAAPVVQQQVVSYAVPVQTTVVQQVPIVQQTIVQAAPVMTYAAPVAAPVCSTVATVPYRAFAPTCR